jgi:deoxyguanosine kinase
MPGDSSRIDICGGIASGKTTLCSLIKQGGWPVIFENFQENPFWLSFYKDPTDYAFETEVTFLLQHYSQIKSGFKDHGRIACDFAPLQDYAYAKVNLTGGRLEAFCAVYQQVISELSAPSLIVHLECSAKEELKRIQCRARSEERGVRLEYLDALNRAIAGDVRAASLATRVLVIDSEINDFACDPVAQARVLEMVLDAVGR